MRLRLAHPILAGCAASLFLALTPPVAAHDRHEDDRPDWRDDGPGGEWSGPAAQLDPATRNAWLADCRRRVGGNPERAQGECAAYLDDYYARADFARPGGYPGYGYGYPSPYGAPAPAYGYPVAACCVAAPVTMVPVQAQPECTETIEYVYEDVPVRPRTYRVRARTKIVRDKRIKVAAGTRTAAR